MLGLNLIHASPGPLCLYMLKQCSASPDASPPIWRRYKAIKKGIFKHFSWSDMVHRLSFKNTLKIYSIVVAAKTV